MFLFVFQSIELYLEFEAPTCHKKNGHNLSEHFHISPKDSPRTILLRFHSSWKDERFGAIYLVIFRAVHFVIGVVHLVFGGVVLLLASITFTEVMRCCLFTKAQQQQIVSVKLY